MEMKNSSEAHNTQLPAHSTFTISCDVHFRPGRYGRKKFKNGEAPSHRSVEPGRIPRISKLMALAIHFDGLIKTGVVRDYADIARLGGVSRARVSQIMNMLLLAPPIQEELLFLPKILTGKNPVTERDIRKILKTPDWEEQLFLWESVKSEEILIGWSSGNDCAP